MKKILFLLVFSLLFPCLGYSIESPFCAPGLYYICGSARVALSSNLQKDKKYNPQSYKGIWACVKRTPTASGKPLLNLTKVKIGNMIYENLKEEEGSGAYPINLDNKQLLLKVDEDNHDMSLQVFDRSNPLSSEMLASIIYRFKTQDSMAPRLETEGYCANSSMMTRYETCPKGRLSVKCKTCNLAITNMVSNLGIFITNVEELYLDSKDREKVNVLAYTDPNSVSGDYMKVRVGVCPVSYKEIDINFEPQVTAQDIITE